MKPPPPYASQESQNLPDIDPKKLIFGGLLPRAGTIRPYLLYPCIEIYPGSNFQPRGCDLNLFSGQKRSPTGLQMLHFLQISRQQNQSLPGTRPRGGYSGILRKKSFRMHLSDPKLFGRISTYGHKRIFKVTCEQYAYASSGISDPLLFLTI